MPPPAAAAAGEGEGRQDGRQRQSGVLTTIVRMVMMWYLMKTFFGGKKAPAPPPPSVGEVSGVPGDSGVPGAPTTIGPLVARGTPVVVSVYLSESSDWRSTRAAEAPAWRAGPVPLGSLPEPLGAVLEYAPSEAVRNNGTAFVHAVLETHGAYEGVPPADGGDAHAFGRTAPLTVHLLAPKRDEGSLLLGKDAKGVDAKRGMNAGEEEKPKHDHSDGTDVLDSSSSSAAAAAAAAAVSPSESESESESSGVRPVLNYYKPNVTIAMVDEFSVFPARQIPPQYRGLLSIDEAAAAYEPMVWFNDFWLLRNQLEEVNASTRVLPVRVELTSSPAWKYTLFSQIEESFSKQREWGAMGESEVDDLKRIFLEGNPYFLGVTMCVSLLHSVFDMLAFKNDIGFWKKNKSMKGLSARSILVNAVCQLVITLYLLDNETSFVVLISSIVGTGIEFWKVTKAMRVAIVKLEKKKTTKKKKKKKEEEEDKNEAKKSAKELAGAKGEEAKETEDDEEYEVVETIVYAFGDAPQATTTDADANADANADFNANVAATVDANANAATAGAPTSAAAASSASCPSSSPSPSSSSSIVSSAICALAGFRSCVDAVLFTPLRRVVSAALVPVASRVPYRLRFRDRDSYVSSETDRYDAEAMQYLSYALYPLVGGYALYSLLYRTHRGWYSWALDSLVGAVYAFGFILMCPQLYLNYKLKSVAHLPWRQMSYKFLNTIIDDLFAFVIKMPLLHRLSVFRDDLVFCVYLYQRWVYRVDKTRVNEFGYVEEDGDEEREENERARGDQSGDGQTVAAERPGGPNGGKSEKNADKPTRTAHGARKAAQAAAQSNSAEDADAAGPEEKKER